VESRASHPDRWAILAVLCSALLVVVIDVTVLHVAAPAISADLDPTALQLLWIIDIYPLVAAPLLLASGVAGDRLSVPSSLVMSTPEGLTSDNVPLAPLTLRVLS
jgi:DHA2 family multidrug resistance protein-like MFS transporter